MEQFIDVIILYAVSIRPQFVSCRSFDHIISVDIFKT